MISNPDLFLEHLTNDYTVGRLYSLGISTPLLRILDNDDLQKIIERDVFFSVMHSPASTSQINVDIPRGSRVIHLDENTIESFVKAEHRVAIVLHEIGHAIVELSVQQRIGSMGSEFAADDFVVSKGFLAELLEALLIGIELMPAKFDTSSNRSRIVRLGKLRMSGK
jgi:hypothetical protein